MKKDKAFSEPTMAFIELTNICEAKCPGCFARGGKEKDQLSIKQWAKILDNLGSSLKFLRITGGEPVNYKYFSEFIKLLEDRALNYIIFTNGLWKSSSQALKLLKKSKYFNGFSFSLHGCNPATHQQFTGIESFDETIKNINRAIKAGFYVQTNTVLGEHNKREVKDIIKFAYELGSKMLVFSRYLGPIRNGISIFKEELNQLVMFLENIKKTGVPVSIGHCLPFCYAHLPFNCMAGRVFYHINYRGNMRPCSFSTAVLGNLLNETPLKILSTTKKAEDWLNNYPEACKGCIMTSTCAGGCKAVREILGIKKDPLMWEPIKKISNKLYCKIKK